MKFKDIKVGETFLRQDDREKFIKTSEECNHKDSGRARRPDSENECIFRNEERVIKA